ncbi:MAG: sulfatase-like hydrolase/transferase, partial [Methylobacter sp.]|uniref:sulfatase-like hydrolase/transferase n=1 Tax=Methylobacter sp. TaxID=2051955 RepID=UPI0025E08958
YSFIMAATLDRVPCVYIENRRVVGLDPNDPILVNYKKPFPGELIGTDVKDRTALKMDRSHSHNDAVINGIGRIGFMTGGKSAIWVDEDMADVFTRHALDFIDREKGGPFFLYFATSDIHKPHVTHSRFTDTTTMGPRGDAIVQFDSCVGEILKKLDELKLTGNTLVILSSDNGPVLDDGYADGANEKLGAHKPAGLFRGGKYSLFEGGTRVPFIVRWPGRVKPGVSDAIVSQVDFPVTLGALAGQKPDTTTMPDSQNVLSALLGESKTGRDCVVEHAGGLSLRSGKWKYIAPGKTRDGLGPWNTVAVPEPGFLFDLSTDPGETKNLAAAYPEKVRELADTLKKISGKNDSKGEQAAVEGGLSRLGAKVIECDSQEAASPAANAIDGDPATIWHTRWKPDADPMPHHLVIDLGRETALNGIKYLPRQNMPKGRWADSTVFCSNDPASWGEAVAAVQWQNDDQWQTLQFKKTVKARYLKVLITSEVEKRPIASAAELDVILAE